LEASGDCVEFGDIWSQRRAPDTNQAAGYMYNGLFSHVGLCIMQIFPALRYNSVLVADLSGPPHLTHWAWNSSSQGLRFTFWLL